MVEEKKLRLKGFSRTAYGTCIMHPDLKICFDIGTFPEQSVHCSLVLISHGHTDHSGCLASHYRARNLMFHTAKTIYMMPRVLIPLAKELLLVTGKLNTVDHPEHWDEKGSNYDNLFHPCDEPLVYKDNQESSIVVHSFPVSHSQEHAVGYEVFKISKKTKKKEEKKESLVVYTGDTDARIFEMKEFDTEMLIMECTYYDDQSFEKKLHEDHGHIHIKDIEQHCHKLSKVKILVLTHCSSRYKDNDIINGFDKCSSIIFSKFQGELWIKMPSGEFRLFSEQKNL